MKIGFLHSLIRKDEKLLLEEFKNRKGVDIELIDDRKLTFSIGRDGFGLDVVLESPTAMFFRIAPLAPINQVSLQNVPQRRLRILLQDSRQLGITRAPRRRAIR